MTTALVSLVKLLPFHFFSLPLSVAWTTVLVATQLCASKDHALRKGNKTQKTIICSRHPHQSRLLASEFLLFYLICLSSDVLSIPSHVRVLQGGTDTAMESCGVNRKKNTTFIKSAYKQESSKDHSFLRSPDPRAVLGMVDRGQMAPGWAPAIQLCRGSCLVKEEVALLGKLCTWSSAHASTELNQSCRASSLQGY